MTTGKEKNALIGELDRVAVETLGYFDGPGRRTNAPVDRWQARDILMHFIYFHDIPGLMLEIAPQRSIPAMLQDAFFVGRGGLRSGWVA